MRKEVVVLLAGLLASCADKEPAAVSFDPLPEVITDGAPRQLGAVATNRAGEQLEGLAIWYEATPTGILQVEKGGTAFCAGSGDVTLKISAGQVSTEVPVKCRLVESVRAPRKLATFLGEGPVSVPVTAMGPGGAELADVPVTFVGYDAEVLEVKDGAIVPVGIGRTTIEATAGTQKSKIEVDVWQKVRSEDVTILKDLEVRLITGHYLVRVNTESPVKLSWKGADCEAREPSLEHELRCKVAPEGTLVVSNVAKGKAATGSLDMYRIP